MPSLPKAVWELAKQLGSSKSSLEATAWLRSSLEQLEAIGSDAVGVGVAMTTPCFFARHQPVVYVIEAQLSESPRPQHPALCQCYRLRTFWQPWEPY